MADIYGALVGTPMQGLGAPQINNFLREGSDHVLFRDVVAVPSGSAIGTRLYLGRYRSTALISPSALIWTDNLGAGVTLNVGDATYPSGLATGVALSAAAQVSIYKVATANYYQPLWKLLGYAADPGGFIDLWGTTAGAATSSAGNVCPQIFGNNR